MSRPAWGHESRHCDRCGKVGPRVATAYGYRHAYCFTAEEQKERRDRKQLVRTNREKIT